jgi:uncharacterized protein (TIGR03437 family)
LFVSIPSRRKSSWNSRDNSVRLILSGLALAGVLAAQTCTFRLSADRQSFPQAGGPGVLFIVASSSTCARMPSASVSWITITFGQQGTGDGTAGFSVAADTDTPMRSGAITIGQQSITITQTGPVCDFAINPRSANLSPLAQNNSFALMGLPGCTWNASSNAPWVQVTSASSGMGPMNISYGVQANPGTSRSGTITVAGLTFMVNQSGACAYTLTPAGGSYSSSGTNGAFTVTSNGGCAWTAAAGASWIHILTGMSGSGPGQVTFALDPNIGDARTATITLAGQTFTVAQASFICSFVLTPAATTVSSAGGTATFSVATPSGCAWTAATTATWITIVAGASGSGPGVVGISAAANPGDARSGTVTVGGQIFTVTQAGAAIMISTNSIANAASWVQGTVSPGMIVTISVPGFGPATTVPQQLSADGTLVTTLLGGAQVLFDGVPAPMLYAASGQFGAVVPYEVAGMSSTQMQVQYQGVASNMVSVPVIQSEPGLFTLDSSGSGQGLIFDAMGNPNSQSNPAAAESVVTLYATGEGQTLPAGIDGLIATDPAPAPALPVSVTIDGINATVIYYGGAIGQVAGMMRIDAQVPDGVASGARPVVVQVGDAQSQTGVTVAIQ